MLRVLSSGAGSSVFLPTPFTVSPPIHSIWRPSNAFSRSKAVPKTALFPILVNSVEQAVSLARDVPDAFLTLASKFWPGALTLVVEATHRLPLKVTGNSGRVALRWADSRIATAVIEAAGGPITGTSANLSGRPSCSNADEIVQQLGAKLSLILDAGDTGGTLASTIVRIDGNEWSIVREGAAPRRREIRKVFEPSSSVAAGFQPAIFSSL